MGKKNIFIDSCETRFGNQLYPIACALTLYGKYPNEFNKPLFKTAGQPKYCLDLLNKFFSDNINYDRIVFDTEWNKSSKEGINDNIITNNSHVRFIGYCQNNDLIDEKIIQQFISIPNDVKEKIYELYGNLSDYICLHVRRGDYLWSDNDKLYKVLSKEYIERVINKYFPNDKIICISDDINWCKENLSNNPNIIFTDKNTGDMSPVIVDFFIQTLTKGNIISASSFSTMGVLLNPNTNKICVAPDPMYNHEPWNSELNIRPRYSIIENLDS